MQGDSFEVIGGQPLKGTLVPQGAKNEALQVICATLLTSQPVTLSNMPDIRDVRRLLELLRGLGVKVEKIKADTYRFEAKDIDLSFFDDAEFQAAARAIRGSVMLIGPLLARYGKAFLPKPGGDKIGRRPIGYAFPWDSKTRRRFPLRSGFQ